MYFIDSDVVAVGAASAQSEAVPAHIHKVMLASTTACWVSYGVNPTATAGDGSFYLPANTDIELSAHPGNKFAVIQAAAPGSLSVAFLS